RNPVVRKGKGAPSRKEKRKSSIETSQKSQTKKSKDQAWRRLATKNKVAQTAGYNLPTHKEKRSIEELLKKHGKFAYLTSKPLGRYYLSTLDLDLRKSLSTTAKLSSGKIITICVPELKNAQLLLENNTNSGLPGPQLLFYLALLNELTQQIPDFKISNAELAKVFTNSWRNSSIEYTNEFIILADLTKYPTRKLEIS
ncbi:7031_t:CDS:2, partial [Entrophospora sp. SA101]